MLPNIVLPSELTNFFVAYFSKSARSILQIIMRILRRDETTVIDFQAIRLFHLMIQPGVMLDVPTFLEHSINSQILNFSVTMCFRFPSLLVYFFKYVHVEEFMDQRLNLCYK